MTPSELKAARDLLGGLDQRVLADESGVSVSTIRRFESGKGIGRLHHDALRAAVEKRGVAFVPKGFLYGERAVHGGVILLHSVRRRRADADDEAVPHAL